MKSNRISRTLAACFAALMMIASAAWPAVAQSGDPYEKRADPKGNRREGLYMLKEIREILDKHYYDRSYRGIDLDERFKAAEEQIKTQDRKWQIVRTIAQVLMDFNDSHTSFVPPDRLFRVEYGFTMMVIGNACFVGDVKPGSDAESKGLKPGDQVVGLGGIVPTRDNFWVINYLIYTLDPQEELKLSLVRADKKQDELTIKSKFLSPKERRAERYKNEKDEQSNPFKCQKVAAETIACKLRTFIVSKDTVDKMMKATSGYKKLILDLRGNGGGYVEAERYLTGYFFNRDVKIGTEVGREKKIERIAQPRRDFFNGELFVLIDSRSASASEVFARTIQIEKRGKVIGDTSMGAVMTSFNMAVPIFANRASNDYGPYRVFGVSVTVGDLIMSDGNRLEGVGVSPDFPVGPTPHALFSKTDPVLSFAAELAGTPLPPEKAGQFYFMIPKPEESNDSEVEEKAGS